MAFCSVYLAKYNTSSNQRTHFAIFIPNARHNGRDLNQDYKSGSCEGTVIHVIGEPVMSGYALEIKRNYECSTSLDLKALVSLGFVDSSHHYYPPYETFAKEDRPRGTLEREATKVPPPRKGQDIRAPIDGVNTKRCQEWTMEYLTRLVSRGLIGPEAVEIAASHRDSPTHGIFGQNRAGQGNATATAAFRGSGSSATTTYATTSYSATSTSRPAASGVSYTASAYSATPTESYWKYSETYGRYYHNHSNGEVEWAPEEGGGSSTKKEKGKGRR